MLSAETFGKGTTNVDFNPTMRAALTQVRVGERLDLAVTPERVAVTSVRGTAVEHKVRLPLRWLKGFAEVQALAAGLEHAATLKGPEARHSLSAVPTQVKARDRVWLLPVEGGLRVSQTAAGGGIASAGLGRLQAMKPLARHAQAMHVYASASGTSAFELDFGSARFTLVLSPAAARGFSGEGQLLFWRSDVVQDPRRREPLAAMTAQTIASGMLLDTDGPRNVRSRTLTNVPRTGPKLFMKVAGARRRF
jgi:hypothetical protein